MMYEKKKQLHVNMLSRHYSSRLIYKITNNPSKNPKSENHSATYVPTIIIV